MKLKYTDIMPLALALFKHLQSSVSHAASQHIDNVDLDELADTIELKMDKWNPTINKKEILDPKTRTYCAKFLAGVTINILR
mgnify:CR=1 FL=1